MSNKLVVRYNEVTKELAAIRGIAKTPTEKETIRTRLAELEAEQIDLRERLRFAALSQLRDIAWLTLGYSSRS